jgi:hypothetical protein
MCDGEKSGWVEADGKHRLKMGWKKKMRKTRMQMTKRTYGKRYELCVSMMKMMQKKSHHV